MRCFALLVAFSCLFISATFSQVQLTDIRSASELSSNPRNFRIVNDNILFIANTQEYGNELWTIDRNTGEAALLKDIHVGEESSIVSLSSALLHGDRLYFIASDYTHGKQIWYTNGKPEGTARLTEIDGFNADYLTIIKNEIYYTSYFQYELAIWKVDVEGKEVELIKRDIPGSGKPIFEGSVNNKFLFLIQDYQSNYYRLWVSDGTDQGTLALTNPVDGNGADSGKPTQFITHNGYLYFVARSSEYFGASSVGVIMTDGTRANTRALPGIYDGSQYLIDEADVYMFNETLYFTFYDARFADLRIYELKGDRGQTIHRTFGAADFNKSNLVQVANKLAFTGQGENGTALVTIDMETYEVEIIKELDTTFDRNKYSSFTLNVLHQLSPDRIFIAVYQEDGYKGWISDLSSENTMRKEEFDDVTHLIEDNQKIYLGVPIAQAGRELGYSDNQLSEPILIEDLNAGVQGIYGLENESYFNDIYFTSLDMEAPDAGFGLYRHTAGTGETVRLADNFQTTGIYPNNLGSSDSHIYFSARHPDLGYELYRVGPDSKTPEFVKDVVPGAKNTAPYEFLTFNNYVFFLGFSETSTGIYKIDGLSVEKVYDAGINDFRAPNRLRELSKTDNRLFGVTEINLVRYNDLTGNTDEFLSLGNIIELATTRSKAYVITGNNITDYVLWVCEESGDPVKIGEDLFKDVSDLFPLGDQIYFTARTLATGRELWVSDGSVTGTHAVADLNQGPASAFPNPVRTYVSTTSANIFTTLNNELLFTASDGVHGSELWKTNGTSEGTVLIKDINPGGEGSIPRNFYPDGEKIYFSAYQPETGYELWSSDGTESGTTIALNLGPGSYGSSPANIHVVDQRLFFTAYSPESGNQLWGFDNTITSTEESQSPPEALFLYPNPAQQVILFSSPLENVEIKSVTGQTLLFYKGHLQTINVADLPEGVYLLRARLNGSFVTRKFIKQ